MPLLGHDPGRRDRPIRTGRRDKPIIQLPSVALRVAVVMGIAVVMFGIVFFRLWFLQILSGQEFVAQANDNRLKSVKIAAPRGNIVDRNGEVIVENRPGTYVGIRLMDVPSGTLDDELAQLAPHLKVKESRLREAIIAYLKPSTMQLNTVTVGDAANEAEIESATRSQKSPDIVNVTTTQPLPATPQVGSMAELSGLQPESYDGLFVITAVKDASHFQVQLASDPGEDAKVSDGKVTEKKWESFLTWQDVVDGEITGVDLIPLKEDVSARIRTYVEEHTTAYPGVEVTDEYLRSYPQGNLAAHVLGYVGPISAEQLKERHFKGYEGGDTVGYTGLEWMYDKWLRGRDGVAKVEVDAQGHPKAGAPVPGGRLAESGDTLVTTLDAKVQKAAQEALKEGIDLAHGDGQYDANGGAAVVLDVKTGGVVAMASYPTFDPSVWVGGISQKKFNRLFVRKKENYPLIDRAVAETKAVGSTFKAVTTVAALEEGVITPASTEWCPGYYESAYDIAEKKTQFGCWLKEGHGELDLYGAIAQSCDTYFYHVGDLFYGRKGSALEDWASRLGFGELTGIDIPGELPGRVPTPRWKQEHYTTEIDKLWKPSDSIYLAVGQGNLEASPLQLAVAYSAIANGGKIVTPHVGLKVVDSTGQTVRDLESAAPEHKVDISQDTLNAVRHGLFEAAQVGTSGPIFNGYKVDVSGKTGTAEVWDGEDNRMVDYAWYASYAPSDNPRYAVVVMIEKGGHGATTAAPATRMIYDALFHIDSGKFTGTITGD